VKNDMEHLQIESRNSGEAQKKTVAKILTNSYETTIKAQTKNM
jgi:hypothetical protein